MMPDVKKILDGKDTSSEEKLGIGNIVTATDKKLEDFIKKSLKFNFPDSETISEESAEETQSKNNNELKFIVDPLDGTTNFTNGWPHTISIGIVYNNELSGGVIYDVLPGKIYFSMKENGVYACDIDDISDFKQVIQPEYKNSAIKKAVISYDTPYGAEAFEKSIQMMTKLYYAGASLKIVGPISLDVLKTALGKENRPIDYNNAVWHTEVRAWDLAAATAILRELGGEIIGIDGKPLSVETLTNPTAKIAFIASGNQKMLENLYSVYIESKKNESMDYEK